MLSRICESIAVKFVDNVGGDDMISIIIPVYNGEAYIDRCLQSLVDQTYQDIEVVVVDDGSIDGTKDRVMSFVNIDYRVKYFWQKHNGTGAARNRGVLYSTGDFIGFVDADDTVSKEFCSHMLSCMSDNIDIVSCGFRITNTNNTIFEELPGDGVVSNSEACINLLEGRNYTGFITNKLFRSSLFEKVSFPNTVLFEDLLTSYACCQEASSLRYTHRALYNYHKRKNSLCTNYDNKRKFTDLVYVCKRIKSMTPQSDYTKSLLLFLYDSLLRLNVYYVRSNTVCTENVFRSCVTAIIKDIQEIQRKESG